MCSHVPLTCRSAPAATSACTAGTFCRAIAVKIGKSSGSWIRVCSFTQQVCNHFCVHYSQRRGERGNLWLSKLIGITVPMQQGLHHSLHVRRVDGHHKRRYSLSSGRSSWGALMPLASSVHSVYVAGCKSDVFV